jgi:hypothetical protein
MERAFGMSIAVPKPIMRKLFVVLSGLVVLACTPKASAASSICISNYLSTNSLTYFRPPVDSDGSQWVCPNTTTNFVAYQQYEFNLASCTAFPTPITVTMCNPGTCPEQPCQNLDTIIYIYRTGGSLTAGTGLVGAFDPSNPCNNLAAFNDDNGDCTNCSPSPSYLSGLTASMGPGRFVVVVCTFSYFYSGSYNLFVSATNAGCALTQATPCPVITVSSSPSTIPVGGINKAYGSVSFSASGGTSPYTYTISGTLPSGMNFNTGNATLSGTPGQGGVFPLMVSAKDSHNCPGTLSFNLIVTNISLPCITDVLSAGTPAYNRPNITANGNGVPSPCTLSGTNVPYRAYEFTVSLPGCTNTITNAAVTATICSITNCDPITGSAALYDSVIYMYRTAGNTNGPGMAGSFDPANPCNNLIGANDDLSGTETSDGGAPACYQNSNLSGLLRMLAPGKFIVVVASPNGETGAYSLTVSAASDDTNCFPTVSMCASGSGTVSGGGVIAPGGSTNVIVTISGGASPYVVTLNNGGGTKTNSSPLTFSVSPSSTTTYSVSSAVDANGCTAFVAGSATVSPGQPKLNIVLTGTNAVISWPGTFAAYSLQYTPSLSATNGWTVYSGARATNAGTIFVTNAVSSTNRFYRLAN